MSDHDTTPGALMGAFDEGQTTDVTVTRPATFQGLTIWCGDTLPVHVDDFMNSVDLRDLIQNPILRAVIVTRLRTIADLIDQEDQEAS